MNKADLLKMIAEHPEEEIRSMLCKWLDCAPAVTDKPCPDCPDCPKAAAPVITLHGISQPEALFFPVPFGTEGDAHEVMMHLDTGAFEMLLTQEVADELGLKNDGSESISGVTGSSTAYTSAVSFNFGPGHVYENVQCTVDPEFTGTPLFGFRFFYDHDLSLRIDPKTGLIEFYAN